MSNKDTDTGPSPGQTATGETQIGDAHAILSRLGRSAPFFAMAYPPGNKRHCELGARPLISGRGHRVGVMLDDELASREHCNRQELEGEKAPVRAATTDPLSGIRNRQTLMSQAQSLYQQCRNNGRSLAMAMAMAMADIDLFKCVNDNWGHPAGDLVIKRVAQPIADHCGPNDHWGHGEDLPEEDVAIELADAALCRAKQDGRNCARLA